MEWWVYLVRCADNSLYCGIAKDPEKRAKNHNQSSSGAAYTRARRPVELVWKEKAPSKSEALKREATIKKMSKAEKEQLVEQFKEIQIVLFTCDVTDIESAEINMLLTSLKIVKELGKTPVL